MKTHGVLAELPLRDIEPEGWLRQYLVTQREGLTGHIDECGYPFNTKGWASPQVSATLEADKGWGPYEQTGYWVDGLIRCGHLLRDAYLIAKARKPFEVVLRRADPDGYLGPKFLKRAITRWPHAVFFRALMAEYSATGDRRIPAALRRHYLSCTCPHTDGPDHRDVCNVEAMLWTFDKTGDRRLLKMAVRAYEGFCRRHPEADTVLPNLLSAKRATCHGVTYNEIAKLGAILYLYTGHRRYLNGTVHAYRKIDRYHMLIDGVCSSMEELKGKDPLDTHETCDIADYTWSVGYLLMATGAAEYADKIERACFNAAPGAVTKDFKALQYFSGPNQVIVDRQSCHGLYQRGQDWMAYLPQQEVQCCPGEVNRIMPNYAARMWMSDGDGGLVAALYGPSRATARVGHAGRQVTVIETTHYPFAETIDFEIRAEAPAAFALGLRIPGWCRGASLALNGQPLKLACRPGTFVRVRREFRDLDRLTLHLPMDVKLTAWPRGGVGVERGPLVYALGIAADARPYPARPGTAKAFPAWDLYPAAPWNYALAVDRKRVTEQIGVEFRTVSCNPWTPETAPVVLRVPARRVAGWKLDRPRRIVTDWYEGSTRLLRERTGRFTFTPQLPDPKSLKPRLRKRTESLTLVPYGCTQLRLAIFPHSVG